VNALTLVFPVTFKVFAVNPLVKIVLPVTVPPDIGKAFISVGVSVISVLKTLPFIDLVNGTYNDAIVPAFKKLYVAQAPPL